LEGPTNPTIAQMMDAMQTGRAAEAMITSSSSFLEEVSTFAASRFRELHPLETQFSAAVIGKALVEGMTVFAYIHQPLMVHNIEEMRQRHKEGEEKKAKQKQSTNGIGEPLSTVKILNDADRMEVLEEYIMDQHGKAEEKEQGKLAKRAAIETERPLVQAFFDAGGTTEKPFGEHWMKSKMTKSELEILAGKKNLLDDHVKTKDSHRKFSGFSRTDQVDYLLEKLKPG
jgi:hypothetical protein